MEKIPLFLYVQDLFDTSCLDQQKLSLSKIISVYGSVKKIDIRLNI